MNKLVHNMSMEDYLAADGVNSSRLKLILKTSLDYKASFDESFEETKSTILGTAAHCLVLEPNSFKERYALEPYDFGDKTKGKVTEPDSPKQKWDRFKADNKDKIVLAWDHAKVLKKLGERADKNFTLKFLLASGRAEVTGFAKDPDSQILLKARCDLLTKDTIWDVKTTANGIDDLSIYKQIMNYKYPFQAAHHTKVFNLLLDNSIKNWGWIFIDIDSPACHIRILHCPASLFRQGVEEHENAMTLLQKATEFGLWEGYPDEITELEIPEWATKNRN